MLIGHRHPERSILTVAGHAHEMHIFRRWLSTIDKQRLEERPFEGRQRTVTLFMAYSLSSEDLFEALFTIGIADGVSRCRNGDNLSKRFYRYPRSLRGRCLKILVVDDSVANAFAWTYIAFCVARYLITIKFMSGESTISKLSILCINWIQILFKETECQVFWWIRTASEFRSCNMNLIGS